MVDQLHSLSPNPTDRQGRNRLIRLQAEVASLLGGTCDLPGCECAGHYDERHLKAMGLATFPARLSDDMVRAIGRLLGYSPKGRKLAAIVSGELEWARGATEEEWAEVLRRAETTAPQRNPTDGSVREGWVRAVLASVRAGT